MTTNDSEEGKSPGSRSAYRSSGMGSKHKKLFPSEELFSDTLEQEPSKPVMDPADELNKLSYELNEFSDLQLPTSEAPERRFENEVSDADTSPPWQAEDSESESGHIPPTVSDETAAPLIPAAPPSSAGGGAAALLSERGSGSGLATALGIVAILAAASAIWLTRGLSEQLASINGQPQTQTHAMDKLQNEEILILKQQLKAMEQAQKRQIQVLDKDVAALKEKIKKPANVAVLKTRAGQKKTAQKVKPAPKIKTPVVKPAAPKTVIKPALTGGWVINLFSFSSEAAARKKVQQLRARGIHAEYAQAIIKGKPWYRVRVARLSSKQAAKKQKKLLASDFGIVDAWISKP